MLNHFSRVLLFVTPWTVAHQVALSMGFPWQECWTRLPFPSPGYLPNPGIEPVSPALQADSLPSEPPGKPFTEMTPFEIVTSSSWQTFHESSGDFNLVDTSKTLSGKYKQSSRIWQRKKKKKTHEQFSLTIVDELFEADHPNEASVKTKTFSNKVSTQQIRGEKSVLTYI